jgi:heme a synthase
VLGLVYGVAPPTAAVLVVGTVVTGSGPHAGDAHSPRTGLDPEQIAQLHADLVFLLVGLTAALLVTLRATDAPARVSRAARDLLLIELAQGVVGFVQYFTHLPVVLVLLHVLGAVLVTGAATRLVWSVRGPASDLPLEAAELPAAAVG